MKSNCLPVQHFYCLVVDQLKSFDLHESMSLGNNLIVKRSLNALKYSRHQFLMDVFAFAALLTISAVFLKVGVNVKWNQYI